MPAGSPDSGGQVRTVPPTRSRTQNDKYMILICTTQEVPDISWMAFGSLYRIFGPTTFSCPPRGAMRSVPSTDRCGLAIVRQITLRGAQPRLHVETEEARHSHLEDHAIRLLRGDGADE